jgi:hypothetical protein
MPDDLRALLLAGSVEFDLGNFALAEQHLAKLVSQNSTTPTRGDFSLRPACSKAMLRRLGRQSHRS